MEEQAPGPAAEPEGRNRIWSSVSHVLSHPLFLLATGAVISAIVVPMFTNRWQDHQHALDVQTQIAADVARATTDFREAVEFSAFKPRTWGGTHLDLAYTRWQGDSAVLDAKLRAYYTGSAPLREWERLRESLNVYYDLRVHSAQPADLRYFLHADLGAQPLLEANFVLIRLANAVVASLLHVSPKI